MGRDLTIRIMLKRFAYVMDVEKNVNLHRQVLTHLFSWSSLRLVEVGENSLGKAQIRYC